MLNNVGKKNALRQEMYEKILVLLDKYEEDDDIRVIVLKGNGGNFSAGFDLSQGMPDSYRDFVKNLMDVSLVGYGMAPSQLYPWLKAIAWGAVSNWQWGRIWFPRLQPGRQYG